MQKFKEIFEAYGGDYQETMGRFLGNEKMYLKFLKMLFADENLAKMGEAIESGDMTKAFEAGHTIKGVSGNLGLKPLYDAVCDIVEPLRNKQEADYAGLYQKIREEYRRAADLRDALTELS
ncbi:MAG: Hpt domain-containing protein [Lachnospiraceae bacterium]|nr:Hpt domain-containing protein [Lachnospiraceae bacterium]